MDDPLAEYVIRSSVIGGDRAMKRGIPDLVFGTRESQDAAKHLRWVLGDKADLPAAQAGIIEHPAEDRKIKFREFL